MSRAMGADRVWLVDRVRELGEGAGRMGIDEIRSRSRSMLEPRQHGDESLELLASALATCREALRRATGVEPDMAAVAGAVQAVGGVGPALASRTDRRAGLGVALYAPGLAGTCVHVVAWDDGGARAFRDFLDPVAAVLDFQVALVTAAMTGAERRAAYEATVTCGSWAELAADYLRDNLHESRADVVQ